MLAARRRAHDAMHDAAPSRAGDAPRQTAIAAARGEAPRAPCVRSNATTNVKTPAAKDASTTRRLPAGAPAVVKLLPSHNHTWPDHSSETEVVDVDPAGQPAADAAAAFTASTTSNDVAAAAVPALSDSDAANLPATADCAGGVALRVAAAELELDGEGCASEREGMVRHAPVFRACVRARSTRGSRDDRRSRDARAMRGQCALRVDAPFGQQPETTPGGARRPPRAAWRRRR